MQFLDCFGHFKTDFLQNLAHTFSWFYSSEIPGISLDFGTIFSFLWQILGLFWLFLMLFFGDFCISCCQYSGTFLGFLVEFFPGFFPKFFPINPGILAGLGVFSSNFGSFCVIFHAIFGVFFHFKLDFLQNFAHPFCCFVSPEIPGISQDFGAIFVF